MAFSLSNGTSVSSFVELAQNSQLSQISFNEASDLSVARGALNGSRSDANCINSSIQGANVTTSSSQTSTPSIIKNRGEQLQSSSSYQQQQSALISNASLAYPFLYPSTYLPGFPTTSSSAAAAAQYNYSSSTVGNGTMQNSQSSTGASNNRRGKKKVPSTQSTNPELRLFFNLRRRDAQVQTNKGQSHIYKPKNPPSLSEWFRRLSIEERVNALSTVCPHLTETFINMFQRIDQSGQSSFARKAGPNSQEQKYFNQSSYMSAYPGFGSFFSTSGNDSSLTSFDEIFYQRSVGETEFLALKNSEKEKFQAEQEILHYIRLTDYQTCLDTLTVTEELVQDADLFLKLMSYATNNQALMSMCQFETKTANATSIEQPSWFKPKSFHSFATWVIVALEENLWAHYNYDNNTNLGQVKANDLSTLFREKTDMGTQDVDLQQLAQFWRDTTEKDKKVVIDQFKALVVKEAEQEYYQSHQSHSKSHKVVHSKSMQYSVHIKEKTERQSFQEQVDIELKWLVDYSLRPGVEMDLLTNLIFTRFDRLSHKQVNINRKFLDLIKKKFKDDLMENLLQEEYSNVKSSKSYKKKKKRNFNSNNNQQSSQAQTINNIEKLNQSSIDTPCLNSDTQTDDQQKNRPKKKKGKQNNQDKNMSSQEQTGNAKKKKNNNSKIRIGIQSKNVELNSCDEKQPKIEDSLDKEDTLESDNKNTSMDTKSSSNLFELATAHQSNNSNTNSSITLQSSQIDNGLSRSNKLKSHQSAANQMIQQQTSKSLDLNQTFKSKSFNDGNFKHQKAISKVESKNYQILQNSSNQELLRKQEDKKSKNSPNQFSESKIFLEDDAKCNEIKELSKEHDLEHESVELIDKYVLELTTSLINEVCKRLENESQVINMEQLKSNGKQKLNTLLVSQLSPQNDDQLDYNQMKPTGVNHKFYGKKHRKDSNKHPLNQKPHEQEDKTFRKKSFNSKKYLKEDKKFSEDYADSTVQQKSTHYDSSTNEVQNSSRKSSNAESYKGNQSQHQRKGFGIHLKNNEKNEDKQQQQQQQHNSTNNSKSELEKSHPWAKGTVKQPDNHTSKKKNHTQKKANEHNNQIGTLTVQSQQSMDQYQQSVNETASNKDDTQSLLNKKKRNKKKSKLTDTDIMNQFMKTLHTHNEEGSSHKTLPQNDYQKKKPIDNNSNVNSKQQYRQQPLDTITEIQQSTSLKHEQLEDNESKVAKPKSYNKRYSQRSTTHNNQNNPEKPQSIQKEITDDQQQQQAPEDQELNAVQTSQQVYQVKKGGNNKMTKQQVPTEPQATLEQATNEQCDNGGINQDKVSDHNSSTSLNEKLYQADQPLQDARNYPFRHINFQSTANDCDNTSMTDLTGTTNSVVDTSSENNAYNNSHSKYQSYQNTPSKLLNTNAKTFNRQQNQYSLQGNQQDASSYRTPPQLAKKQHSQQNYSHHGHYNKKNHHHNQQQFHPQSSDTQYNQQMNNNYHGYNQSHNGNQKNNSRPNNQYRQVNRTHQSQSNVYMQPMNITQSMQEQQQQQYMQTFMNPENNNIFYQDQNMPINPTQNVDTFVPKSQEQIFSYVEKNLMMIQQPHPCYSPSQYHMNQYMPPLQHDVVPNPFSYQGVNMPYFDQSQDLIFQIFNSIKSNHSMSPIPPMISSPPLLDFQMSQSSDLSFGGAQRFDPSVIPTQESQFLQMFDYQIEQFVKGIENNLAYLKPERTFVLNKLTEVCKQVFYGQSPQLELFGSLITGLALESSDMDIAVTGLKIDERFVMISELNKLANALQDWKVLESFKAIETASIPVIKMSVDLQKLRQLEMTETSHGDFESRPIPENQRYLSLDITFDDSPIGNSSIKAQSLTAQDLLGASNQSKCHLGLQSCTLVQYYIQNYKNLKEVAILLKKFLAIHSFNSPYYGGISSYSTVILIVAYMNYFNLRGDILDLTPSRLLMGFLDFYGNYFNPGSMGISVYEDGLLDSNIVILDPLNLQNNTTRNSYLTKEILLKFQCAFNNLKSLMYKLPQLQQAVNLSSTAFQRANSQDQKSSIPVKRASPQPSTFQSQDRRLQESSINQFMLNTNQELEEGCGKNLLNEIKPEEKEAASNIAMDVTQGQQKNGPIHGQVYLLETFFAKDSQPVTDLQGSLSSQTEPRGTLITINDEAHAQ